MKLLQQAPQQAGAGSSSWSGGSSGLSKAGKSTLALLEMQQEAERLLKQQRAQQQRERVSLRTPPR